MGKSLTNNRVTHPRRLMTVLMLAADSIGWGLSLALVWVVGQWVEILYMDFHPGFVLAYFIYLALAVSQNLYKFVGLTPVDEIKRMFSVSGYTLVILILLTLGLDPQSGLKLLTTLFLFWVFCVPAILFARWSLRILAVRLGAWGEPMALMTSSKGVEALVGYFRQRARLGIIPKIVATLDKEADAPFNGGLEQITVADLLDSPKDRFAKAGIHTLFVDMSAITLLAPSVSSQRLFTLFKEVVLISEMDWIGGATMHLHDYESLAGIAFRQHVLGPARSVFKRVIDIGGALLLGLFSMPLWVLTIVAIKRDSPGAVFYTQERVGKDGRTIKIYKFRTMVENADEILGKYLEGNPAARREWDQAQKLKDDPRITRSGVWIRRFSIDELPQLLNVLKGEMSLVGPRPIVEAEVHHYGENYKVYSNLNPGLTGMWQVSGRNHASYPERVRFDLYYAHNWSIWLDIYILVRTIWVVLTRYGAY